MTATIRRAPRSLTQKMVVGGTVTDSCVDFLLRLKKLKGKIPKIRMVEKVINFAKKKGFSV